METTTYQGFTNRETWLVKLWIDNDEPTQNYWQAIARDALTENDIPAAVESLRTVLEDEFKLAAPEIQNGVHADLMTAALQNVCWSEVAASLCGDVRENSLAEQTEDGWTLIDGYSRAQAIEDGTLVDASKLAKEAGFKYPVALTSAAWSECVEVPAGADDQDEIGRLCDVLNVLFFRIKSLPKAGHTPMVHFTVSVRTGEVTSEEIHLKSLCGPRDNAEPVITIMLPHED